MLGTSGSERAIQSRGERDAVSPREDPGAQLFRRSVAYERFGSQRVAASVEPSATGLVATAGRQVLAPASFLRMRTIPVDAYKVRNSLYLTANTF